MALDREMVDREHDGPEGRMDEPAFGIGKASLLYLDMGKVIDSSMHSYPSIDAK
jgi:hypothetical protein